MKKSKYVLAFLFVLIVSLINIKVITQDDSKKVSLSLAREASAVEDPQQSKYLPHAYLATKACWYLNVTIDDILKVGNVYIPWGSIKAGTNGDKWYCEIVPQDVSCEIAKQTACLPPVD